LLSIRIAPAKIQKDFDNEPIYQIFLVGKAQKEADLEKS